MCNFDIDSIMYQNIHDIIFGNYPTPSPAYLPTATPQDTGAVTRSGFIVTVLPTRKSLKIWGMILVKMKEAILSFSGKDATRGKRVKVKHLCHNCYSQRSLAEDRHIEEVEDRNGRSYLPICLQCLRSGVPVAWRKGGRRNVVQATAEKKRKKSVQKKKTQKLNKSS